MSGGPQVQRRPGRLDVQLAVLALLAALLVVVAAFAQALVPFDPYAQDLSIALQAPSAGHWLGTDRYGRDLLSRVIMGAQASVFSTLALVAIAAVAGVVAGMLAGWFGGWADTLLMRVSDVFLAFPGLVLALAVASVLGGGLANAVIALAAISWPKYARVARGLTLTQREADYVAAARVAGCGPARLVFRHVLPNIAGPVLVTAVLDIGTMMMELAGLSFLGLGAQVPAAEWGSMISDSRNLLQTAPWTVFAPGAAIFLTVAAFNLLGDTLRDWMDPQRRARRGLCSVRSGSERVLAGQDVAVSPESLQKIGVLQEEEPGQAGCTGPEAGCARQTGGSGGPDQPDSGQLRGAAGGNHADPSAKLGKSGAHSEIPAQMPCGQAPVALAGLPAGQAEDAAVPPAERDAAVRQAAGAGLRPARWGVRAQAPTITRRRFVAGLGAAALVGAGVGAGLGWQAGRSVGGASGAAGGSAATSFTFGTTGYGVEMDDAGLNPHSAYSGWSCVRYGVGETLFRFSDAMEPQAWLATSYEFIDETHCVITLREGVYFSSGRELDARAVKECLEDLVAVHDRAPTDTNIASIEADGLTLTIETSEPTPALVSYLCDPYGAIIDMQAGVTDAGNVSGTGPFVATAVTDTEVTLERNAGYWDGVAGVQQVVVRSITDGDTLANALQAGEVDATYGLAYASYELFEDASAFHIASCDTSRTFFGQVNYESALMQDAAVREAICLGIDKDGFIETLLGGRGVAAVGPFTAEMAFGDGQVTAPGYDPEAAMRLLEEAGWMDTDGDGVRERDGQKLTLRWLTYPGRQELPLLAEYAQSTLGEIGFDVQVNNTENHIDIRTDASAWDVYASAMVTAPTGEAEYFFTATCLQGSSKNFGGYRNTRLEELVGELGREFDTQARCELAVEAQQLLLDDHGFFFVSHLTMGIVARSGVSGIEPHPCDYYEVTADLTVE